VLTSTSSLLTRCAILQIGVAQPQFGDGERLVQDLLQRKTALASTFIGV
jgi:hypothetical protein